MRPILLLSLTLTFQSAQAATLRAMASLSSPAVHIADLWDDAGAAGARVLGPAPAPGNRITVGAAQLGAIARAYGVDWQPGSDADQAVLDRPGQTLPLDAVLATLRPALAAAGAGADFDIALPFYDPPMLDAGPLPRLSVDRATLDATSGRFSATLTVQTATDPLQLRLAGTIAASVAVAVPTRRLLPGSLIGPGDLQLSRVRASLVSASVALDPAQAAGLQLRHMAFPGQPIPLTDLVHPTAVLKGDRVMMALVLPGLDLGAVGLALETGAIGDRVTVRNPVSGATLVAEVTGADQVRVAPDPPAARTVLAAR